MISLRKIISEIRGWCSHSKKTQQPILPVEKQHSGQLRASSLQTSPPLPLQEPLHPVIPQIITITNPNDTVFKVNGNVGGHKMGPSLLLKVMSGDKVDIAVQSFYNTGTTSTPNTSLTDVLASLATGIVNMTAGGKGSLTDLNNTGASPIYAALNSFLPNDDPNTSG